jgi:hypothetical protein
MLTNLFAIAPRGPRLQWGNVVAAMRSTVYSPNKKSLLSHHSQNLYKDFRLLQAY